MAKSTIFNITLLFYAVFKYYVCVQVLPYFFIWTCMIPRSQHVSTSRVENSVDPDQLASQKPADLNLHCFQNRISLGTACYWDNSPTRQGFFPFKKNLDPYNKTDPDFGDFFFLSLQNPIFRLTCTIQFYWYAIFFRKNTPTSRQTQL